MDRLWRRLKEKSKRLVQCFSTIITMALLLTSRTELVSRMSDGGSALRWGILITMDGRIFTLLTGGKIGFTTTIMTALLPTLRKRQGWHLVAGLRGELGVTTIMMASSTCLFLVT